MIEIIIYFSHDSLYENKIIHVYQSLKAVLIYSIRMLDII